MAESTELGKRQCVELLTFDNKMWAIGGWKITAEEPYQGNEVWYSTDGKNWTLASEETTGPAIGRGGHACLVFDDKMWVLGGGVRNDVWSSSDGSNWTCVTQSASWPARSKHAAVVYNGKMWIMGGTGGSGSSGTGRKNDVWSSTDGVEWKNETESAGWIIREGPKAVSFKGKIWLTGGEGMVPTGSGSALGCWNDVWSYQEPVNVIDDYNNLSKKGNSLIVLNYHRKNGVIVVYSLQKTEDINISVYNSTGKKLAVLCNEVKTPGTFTIQWTGTNKYGKQVSSGVYYVTFNTREGTISRKIILGN